ncbi:MAG TPA: ferritin family protein [Acidobacteriota bacterium]|nr:ferritin family protein [Acidobacteriota bacterium]
MNIFEYAMKLEKDGENYYRELAEKVENPGIKNILTMLADDEVKHYNIFKNMSEKTEPSMQETDVLKKSRNIFTDMQGKEIDSGIGQKEMYRKAQDLEKKTQDFYEKKASEVHDAAQKELFLKIADEEKRHYFLLENIINFVSRPETWLEDAEFNHLEDY